MAKFMRGETAKLICWVLGLGILGLFYAAYRSGNDVGNIDWLPVAVGAAAGAVLGGILLLRSARWWNASWWEAHKTTPLVYCNWYGAIALRGGKWRIYLDWLTDVPEFDYFPAAEAEATRLIRERLEESSRRIRRWTFGILAAAGTAAVIGATVGLIGPIF